MTYEVYLAHHGIKGQKWGVRRYYNEDGTLTEAGKKRQRREEEKELKDYFRKDTGMSRKDAKESAKAISDIRKNYDDNKGKWRFEAQDEEKLNAVISKMTKKDYETANNFVINATKNLVKKGPNGEDVLDEARAQKALSATKKMRDEYQALGNAALRSLKLDDKYDFISAFDSSLSGVFLTNFVIGRDNSYYPAEQFRKDTEQIDDKIMKKYRK